MRRLILALALGALAATGCGGDDDQPQEGSAREPPPGTETAPARGGTKVEMTDRLTFEPKVIEVAVGEEGPAGTPARWPTPSPPTSRRLPIPR
jgi:hypothetical protein